MYTMNWLVAFSSLQALASGVQGYAIDPADPTITAAPEANLLLQERQAGFVTCSEWSIYGGYHPICPSYSTCLVQDTSYGYAGCFYTSASSFTFKTACYDYPTSYTYSTANDVYCPYSAPYCGYIKYLSGSSTWYGSGCSSSRWSATAYYDTHYDSSTARTTTSSYYYTPSTTSDYSGPTPSALLGLGGSPDSSGSSSNPPSSSSNAAVIGGAVGGAVGGLALIVGGILLFIFMRRRNRRSGEPNGAGIAVEQPPPEYKSPSAFEPPMEFKSPPSDVKPTGHVSAHC